MSMIPLLRKKKLDRTVAHCIAVDMRPLAMVNGKGFRLMFEEAVPGYKLPAPKTLRNKIIPDMVKEGKAILKEELKGTDWIAITSDGWTDNSMTPFIAVTTHYITEEKYLKAKCLDCSM